VLLDVLLEAKDFLGYVSAEDYSDEVATVGYGNHGEVLFEHQFSDVWDAVAKGNRNGFYHEFPDWCVDFCACAENVSLGYQSNKVLAF